MNILVGCNVNEDIDKLTGIAKNEALAYSANITLLYVNDVQPYNEAQKKIVQSCRDKLSRVKDDFEAFNIDCISRLEYGVAPGETLVDIANIENYDRVIIGIRHRSRTGKFIMGSTSQYIILEAKCPVLCVS